METTTKATLADVNRLDYMWHGSLILVRAIGTGGDDTVTAYGVPGSNTRGDRWHTCWVETRRRRYDSFELTGPPSKVGLMLDREVRDFVNGPGDYT